VLRKAYGPKRKGQETAENSLTATFMILLHKFHSDAPRGENEMGGACSSMVKGKALRVMVGKPEEKATWKT
jgi:hypothetical protein